MTPIRLVATFDQLFTRAKSGAVWGRIYFEIDDGQFFPNNEWTDLLVAFSCGWLDCLLQIAQGKTLKATVPFYDGPFAVDAAVNSPGVVQLSFVARETVKYAAKSAIETLLKDAVSAAGQVLTNCRDKGWTNKDTEALETLLTEGANVLAKFRSA